MSRPEHIAPAEIYYGEENAARYARNSRNAEIQAKMTERALELLALPESDEPALLLDIGCGSGLSSETISENGHIFVGNDFRSVGKLHGKILILFIGPEQNRPNAKQVNQCQWNHILPA